MFCRTRKPEATRIAFTLVELLVVIAIIGVLIGFALPAIQAARESSRRTSCLNNVSHITKAILQHDSQNRHFPTGGWGPTWLGVGSRPTDAAQPGGWIYSVLPYLEEQPLFDSLSDFSNGCDATYQSLVSAKLPMFACPTRRVAAPKPLAQTTGYCGECSTSITLTSASRSDYAANSGSLGRCIDLKKFRSQLAAAYSGNAKVPVCCMQSNEPKDHEVPVSQIINQAGHYGDSHGDDYIGKCNTCNESMDTILVDNPDSLVEGDTWRKQTIAQKIVRAMGTDRGIPDLQNGMIFRMSRITDGAVLDGLSNVYLLGEKYVAQDKYQTGADSGDDRPMMVGYSSSNVRWGVEPPARDTSGVSHPNGFGSAHPAGWMASFGDGAVKLISFDIDPVLHMRLADRADRLVAIPP